MRTPAPLHLASGLVVIAAAAVAASFVLLRSEPVEPAASPASGQVATATRSPLTKQVAVDGTIGSAAVWDIGDGASAMREDASTSTLATQGGTKVVSVAVRVGAQVRQGQVLARLDDTVAALRVTAAQQALDAALDARNEISTSNSTTVTTSTQAGGGPGGDGAASGAAPGGAFTSASPATNTGSPRVSTAKSKVQAKPAAPTGPTTDVGGNAGDDAVSHPPEGTKPDAIKPNGNGTGGMPTKPAVGGGAAGGGAGGGSAPRPGGAGAGPARSTTTRRQSTAELVARADAAIIAARSALATARAAKSATVLRAPTAGVVTARELVRGATTPAGPAFTIRSDGARVTLTVEEADVVGMSVGDAATITVSALGAELTGRVASVGAATGGAAAGSVVTYPVTVVVDKRIAGLRDGMSVSVSITTAQVDEALVVPAGSIRTRADRTIVRIRDDDGSTRDVDVEVGLETASGVQIMSGDIAAGDTVVLPAAATGSSSTNRTRQGFGAGGGAMRMPGGMR